KGVILWTNSRKLVRLGLIFCAATKYVPRMVFACRARRFAARSGRSEGDVAVFPLTEFCEISAVLRALEERFYAPRRNRKKETALAARARTLATNLRGRVTKAFPALAKDAFPLPELDHFLETLKEFDGAPMDRQGILLHIARTTADEEFLPGLRW